MVQHIRPSQFVITYGPGAILETRNGPRIILKIEHGLPNVKYQDFEIADLRMSASLGGKVFRLPTNDELGKKPNDYVYRTRAFPEWKVCTNRSGHKGDFDTIFSKKWICPLCGIEKWKPSGSSWRAVLATWMILTGIGWCMKGVGVTVVST
ncbi:hypothetical protein B9Q04_02340 [Candidatus Marsarchaeota G2 archaeon BE_D]|jgi:hypothetical protein|uniref:Uncharacterized protein n=1 Tax=Candidatus Marsarchaeota G2 archaeon BE_D TaxID=1978158 RepID=A0A2R6CE01_9ARCH|nr:MAG: hypothetical protein B9Q04_02340 [Candidatus Marsarchaeota G2 archaeon BE_D]